MLYLYEQLNKKAPINERNSLIISFYGISLHSLNKSDHNPTPNFHFSQTQKSVGLYLAHYGILCGVDDPTQNCLNCNPLNYAGQKNYFYIDHIDSQILTDMYCCVKGIKYSLCCII